MNKKILFIIIIIAVGIFYWIYKLTAEELKSEYDNTFTFICNSDKEIKISYNEEGNSASLFIEGEKYELHRVISASGARYANDDETAVFWEHQGEAMVEIDGETIYKECNLKE